MADDRPTPPEAPAAPPSDPSTSPELTPGERVVVLAVQALDRRVVALADAALAREQHVNGRLDALGVRIDGIEQGTPTSPPAVALARAAEAHASKVGLEQEAFQGRVLGELGSVRGEIAAVKDAQAQATGAKVWGARLAQLALLIAGAVTWALEHWPAHAPGSRAPALTSGGAP